MNLSIKALIYILLIIPTLDSFSQNTNKECIYVCTPCDLDCDSLTFEKAGICPHCKMELVLKSELEADLNMIVNEINIKNGSGKFLIEGGYDNSKTILTHYHKPKNFTKDSKVVFVLPGAGRNGDDYRDAWINKAEEYGVLVISPEYSEENYPEFWNYNLAGMYKDVKINKERTSIESFTISDNPDEWIYNDFDRIFEMVNEELDLKTSTYDMFGHSAGGQILHRFAIFHPNNKANRILAANSGWYTIPRDSEDFPYGLKCSVQLSNKVDFSSNLIVFLGEKDNANETRGSLRSSPEADQQGLHRLERGNYFFDASKETAANRKKEFNWKIEIITGVGHDYKKMGEAAADYLYKVEQ